jgi:hypothetical protein
MAMIFELNRHLIKCPVGAAAHHPQHGIVSVVATTGLMRTIEVESIRPAPHGFVEPLPEGVLPEEIIHTDIITVTYFDVHVGELTALAPSRQHKPTTGWSSR